MTRGRRRWLLVGLALVLAVSAVLVVRHVRQTAQVAANCRAVTAARDALLHQAPDARIAVLGDSYSQGSGLTGGAADAFPALLSAAVREPVTVDGLGSTGFTTRGYCGDRPVTYGDRLRADHLVGRRVVIVEGGVNDALTGHPQDVASAAGRILAALKSSPTVIVVGPPAITSASSTAVRAVDAALRKATSSAGRTYVPLIAERITLGADGTHPTREGQQRIADLIRAEVVRAAG